jgi:hypothetical protein
MWGQRPWAWGWRRNGWSFGVDDAPACAGGWRRTRRLDGVHLGGRGRCTTKPSSSFRKPSRLQYWWPPSPSWPNYGRWWVGESAVSGVDHDARRQKNRPTTPRGTWVLRGRAPNFQGIYSMHRRAGKKRKVRLGICTRWTIKFHEFFCKITKYVSVSNIIVQFKCGTREVERVSWMSSCTVT